MKINILLVLSLVTTLFVTSCNTDTTELGNWVTMSNFTGYSRANATCFCFDSVTYYGMGEDYYDYLSDFYKYDVKKDAWFQVSSFPGTPRAYNISVTTKTKGYIGLGYDGDNDLSDFWEYDPATDKWTQLTAVFPGGARKNASAFAIGDAIYVGLGTTGKDPKYHNDFFRYYNGKWDTIAPCKGEKRAMANVVTLNGKAYVISGYHNSALTDMWEYDPATDNWRAYKKTNNENSGNSAVARWDACAFVSGGNIYLAGGTSGSSSLSTVFEWNPSDTTWVEKTSIETGRTRQGASCFVVNDFGYILGGRAGNNYLDDMYKFQPWLEKDLDDN